MDHKGFAILVAVSTLALGACGGGAGGGGGGTAFIPTPPSSPPPAGGDPNPVAPPMPAGAVGLIGGPFTTFSASADSTGLITGTDQFRISYSPDGNVYTVSGPGVEEGRLINAEIFGGSWLQGSNTWQTITATRSFVSAGNSTVPQTNASVFLDWANAPYSQSDLTYTSFGSWSGASAGGSFVYGSAAPVSAIPATGTATYSGTVRGYTSGDGPLWGNIGLQFDFAGGSLAGSITAAVSDPTGWDALSIGTYAFSGTIASGTGSFAGAFSVPGSTAASSLDGKFTGLDASELMGSFLAPYLSPNTNQWGTMNGVFAGKKGP